jgi:hypothetical protein
MRARSGASSGKYVKRGRLIPGDGTVWNAVMVGRRNPPRLAYRSDPGGRRSGRAALAGAAMTDLLSSDIMQRGLWTGERS